MQNFHFTQPRVQRGFRVAKDRFHSLHLGRTHALHNVGAHGRGGGADLDCADELLAEVLHRHHARLDLCVRARARGGRPQAGHEERQIYSTYMHLYGVRAFD